MPTEREIIETLSKFPNGKTLPELATYFERGSYWTIRAPLLRLVQNGVVDARAKQGHAKLYRVFTSDGNGPVVSNVDPAKAPVAVVALLHALASKPPNEQQHVRLIKRLGLQIAMLAKFAQLWKDDESPAEDEVSLLRAEMEEANLRALWLHKVYNSILNNEDLWNPFNAYALWSKELSSDRLDQLIEDLRKQEYNG